MKTILKLSAVIFATIALSGCVATVTSLAKKTDDAIAKMVETAQKKTRAEEYDAFARAEIDMLQRLTEQAKLAGLTWNYADRKITVRSRESRSTQSVLLAASFRSELPADAITARHQAVLTAIDALAERIAQRSKFEPTRLVIVARNQADAAWLRMAAAGTLSRLGAAHIYINTEIASQTAIGWMSEGPVDREI